MIFYWAHVDESGAIVSWGQCAQEDAALQDVPQGLTFVIRPDYVTGYDAWKYVNQQWMKEAPP
jgi:hypothetical protein